VSVSRAVAPLKDLWKWSKPLLKKDSQWSIANSQSGEENNLVIPNGLICLKGGDLAHEISESNCRPRLIEISEIFSEEYFKEKFLLHVPFG